VIDGIAQSTDAGMTEISGAPGTSKVIVIDDGEQHAERVITFSNDAPAAPEIIELPARIPAASLSPARKPTPSRSAPQAGAPSASATSAQTPPTAPTINTTW
jgi:hypothetical protein